MLNPYRYTQPSLLDFPRYMLSDPFFTMPSQLSSAEVQMPDLRETDSGYQYASALSRAADILACPLLGPRLPALWSSQVCICSRLSARRRF